MRVTRLYAPGHLGIKSVEQDLIDRILDKLRHKHISDRANATITVYINAVTDKGIYCTCHVRCRKKFEGVWGVIIKWREQ